jgi:predicted nucleic acid-binding protein
LTALLDSSVWIPYLRERRHAGAIDALIARGRALLHSVVVLELYAGSSSMGDKRDVDVIVAAARRLGSLVHPSSEDFAQAGQMLSEHSRGYGRVRPRDHSHDLLIAIGAARSGGLLLTEDLSHMRRWAKAIQRRLKLTLHVRAP